MPASSRRSSLGLLITIGLWWTYFDRFAQVAEARLREHDDPVLAAADAYSYLHLLLVAGIIVFAVGRQVRGPRRRTTRSRTRLGSPCAAGSPCTSSATSRSGGG